MAAKKGECIPCEARKKELKRAKVKPMVGRRYRAWDFASWTRLKFRRRIGRNAMRKRGKRA